MLLMTRANLLTTAAGVLCCCCCCCCSADGGTEMFGALWPEGERTLHLLWPCTNASECGKQGAKAKLCFINMDGWQNLNGSMVSMEAIQLASGSRYRYIKFLLPESHTECAQTYKPALEFQRDNNNGSKWYSGPKCDKPDVIASCAIRFPSSAPSLCSDGAGWHCDIDRSLPGDIASFLVSVDKLPETEVGYHWAAVAASSAAVITLVLIGTLVWAHLTGRLCPPRDHVGEGPAWDKLDLEFLHPDSKAVLLAPTWAFCADDADSQ